MGAIDDTEYSNFKFILSNCFLSPNYLGTIAVEVNPAGQNIRPNVPARSHDYFHLFAKNIDAIKMLPRGLTLEERKQYKEKDQIGKFYWDNLRRRGGNSRPSDRPKQWYPLFVAGNRVRVPKMEFNLKEKKWILLENIAPGELEMWPIDPKGESRIWRSNPTGTQERINKGDITVIDKAGRREISLKSREPDGKKPKTLWSESKYSATSYGTKLLIEILGAGFEFSYPKSIHLTQEAISYWAADESITLDYFAGSGTTAHAVINLNREDNGSRKYILVEMGDHFDTVLKPRTQKVVYSALWKQGKPTAPETGISHAFKYLRLESYEDALNNLDLGADRAPDLLGLGDQVREDYLFSYLLDVETRGHLMNLNHFRDPWGCQLKIHDPHTGKSEPRAIDLVETFHYLLGITVREVRVKGDGGGFLTIEGETSQGDTVLIIWRKLAGESDWPNTTNSDLKKFVASKLRLNPADTEYHAIYVNGDHTLEDPHSKIHCIEEVFYERMFENTGTPED
jgi:adenine-specific DNA-methyltransferase